MLQTEHYVQVQPAMKEGQKIVLDAPFDLVGMKMKESEYR